MPLCAKCGNIVSATDVQFCPKCGAPFLSTGLMDIMQENIGVQLNDVAPAQVGFNKHFDLYFTDKRVVAVNIGRDQAVGYLAGGYLGKAIAKRGQTQERKERSSLTLDQMIAQDPKDNFAIPYDAVQSIKISPPNLVVKGSLEIRSTDQNKKYFLSKDDYKSLKSFLPNLPNMTGRLEVK